MDPMMINETRKKGRDEVLRRSGLDPVEVDQEATFTFFKIITFPVWFPIRLSLRVWRKVVH